MRRGKPEDRPIPPDIKYNSVSLQTLVQHMMQRGKKSTAARIIYDTLDIIAEKTGKNPMETFDAALRNVGPLMEVRPRRVGGATYQVPMEVPGNRRLTLSLRWLLQAAEARSGKSFADKLSSELLDAASNQGAAIRKREEAHKMAEANRAFSHYRV
jgi:small subunit ribosomal protein S7